MDTFAILYNRYSPDGFRVAYWLCGNAADAEDITSETFLRAWAGADNLRMETVKSYLFAIAKNLFLEKNRRQPRARELAGEFADNAPTPEAISEDKSRLSQVLQDLAALPHTDRAAPVMRFRLRASCW